MSRNHPVAGRPILRFGDEKDGAALRVETSEATENMASWLQDVARRPWPQESRSAAARVAADAPAAASAAVADPAVAATRTAGSSKWSVPLRHSVILTALAGAFMQYYFIDVNLRIVTMHSVTVFAPVGTTKHRVIVSRTGPRAGHPAPVPAAQRGHNQPA